MARYTTPKLGEELTIISATDRRYGQRWRVVGHRAPDFTILRRVDLEDDPEPEEMLTRIRERTDD
jgi:hypothetical protein